MIRIILTLAILLHAGIAAADESAFPFAVQKIDYETVDNEVFFDATIEAVKQATVSAQTGGRIEEIFFDVDDYVTKGDVILRFRDREQQARLTTAQAGLQEAQARLQEAEQEFARVEGIYAKKLVAKSALDTAAANLKAARAKMSAAASGLQEAQEQLEHTVVRAPYSGIVVKRYVEPGEAANIGQPLMTGLSLDQLRAVVNLPQQYVEAVRQNNKVRLRLSAEQDRVFTPEHMVVFPFADSASHTFRVRLDLPSGLQGLYPGMFVKIGLVFGSERRLLVPVEAVAYRGEVVAVYVVSDQGGIRMRQVRLGRSVDGRVTVLSGLNAGERVALDPVRAAIYLKER